MEESERVVKDPIREDQGSDELTGGGARGSLLVVGGAGTLFPAFSFEPLSSQPKAKKETGLGVVVLAIRVFFFLPWRKAH